MLTPSLCQTCTSQWSTYKQVTEGPFHTQDSYSFKVRRNTVFRCSNGRLKFQTSRSLIRLPFLNNLFVFNRFSGFGQCADSCNQKTVPVNVVYIGNLNLNVNIFEEKTYTFQYLNQNCDKLYWSQWIEHEDCSSSKEYIRTRTCLDCDGDELFSSRYCNGPTTEIVKCRRNRILKDSTSRPPCRGAKCKSGKSILLYIIVGGLGGLVLLIVISVFLVRMKRKPLPLPSVQFQQNRSRSIEVESKSCTSNDAAQLQTNQNLQSAHNNLPSYKSQASSCKPQILPLLKAPSSRVMQNCSSSGTQSSATTNSQHFAQPYVQRVQSSEANNISFFTTDPSYTLTNNHLPSRNTHHSPSSSNHQLQPYQTHKRQASNPRNLPLSSTSSSRAYENAQSSSSKVVIRINQSEAEASQYYNHSVPEPPLYNEIYGPDLDYDNHSYIDVNSSSYNHPSQTL